MATTIDVIRDRIASVCAGIPFQFAEAPTPFDFDLQPTGLIDGSYRLTCEHGSVIGGFNYSEERTDLVDVWIARKQKADPKTAYRLLTADVSSLRSAIVRDGLNGDYFVPDDGSGFSVSHEDGQEYAVLKLTIPVNFEAEL
jgi:hypothetical protein